MNAKTPTRRFKASALAVALAGLTLSLSAQAAIVEIGDGAVVHEVGTDGSGVAIGRNASAQTGTNAGEQGGIAIGDSAATGTGISIGNNAQSNLNSYAFGHGSRALGAHSLALGSDAISQGYGSIAIGQNADCNTLDYQDVAACTVLGRGAMNDDGGVSIGGNAQSSRNGIAVGNNAGGWTNGVAVGTGAFAQEHGVAIGTGARATWGSVALGVGSIVPDGVSGVVSVGNESARRRIINVGFGENGNDAVVFDQVVPGLNGLVSGLGGGATYDPATGVMSAPSYALGVGTFDNVGDALVAIDAALGGAGGGTPQPSRYFKADGMNDGSDDAQADGTYATAMGTRANAAGVESLAAGASSEAIGNGATAVGAYASANSGETGGATALGNYAMANGSWALSVGASAEAQGEFSTALGAGSRAAETALAVGVGAHAQGHVSMALGLTAQAEGDAAVALGNNARAAGHASTALGTATVASADCVALGSFTSCDEDATVSVGNGNEGLSSRVVNMSAGRDANDAVNVGQIAPFADALGGGATFAGGVFVAPNYAFRDGTNHTNVGSGLDNLDARVWSLENAPGGNEVPGPQGPQGPAGADGRSAYEVAVDNGFEGNEQQWLESLRGADGRDGADGVGGGTQVAAGRNIEVEDNEDGTRSVHLSDHVELTEQGSVAVGDTTMDAQGVRIDGGPSMTRRGVDAGNQRITRVADGRIERGSTDAINGGQIWAIQQDMNDRWDIMERRVDGLESRIDAVGAQAAAMAQMNGAGYHLGVGEVAVTGAWGQYGNKSAFALGMKIRSSEKTSWSMGVSVAPDGKAMGGVGFAHTLR